MSDDTRFAICLLIAAVVLALIAWDARNVKRQARAERGTR